ncbi:MAG: cytochrome C oxidase subunit IV family protein [Candidatus Eisenbacteria bacterium]|nr:cytochrome C oxidase subunit IV family protein [Candidatus Eisenbacteria bacterium]
MASERTVRSGREREREGEGQGGGDHPGGLLHYWIVCAVLLGLAAATSLLALVDLGPLHTPVGLAIAVTKATLVAIYFMHLRSSPKLLLVVLLAGVLWLGVLMLGTLDDFLTRSWFS